jgi:hypothetical protein
VSFVDCRRENQRTKNGLVTRRFRCTLVISKGVLPLPSGARRLSVIREGPVVSTGTVSWSDDRQQAILTRVPRRGSYTMKITTVTGRHVSRTLSLS